MLFSYALPHLHFAPNLFLMRYEHLQQSTRSAKHSALVPDCQRIGPSNMHCSAALPCHPPATEARTRMLRTRTIAALLRHVAAGSRRVAAAAAAAAPVAIMRTTHAVRACSHAPSVSAQLVDLAKRRKNTAVAARLQQASARGQLLTPEAYEAGARALVALRRLDDAMHLVDGMLARGVQPTESMLAFLIEANGRAGHWRVALRLHSRTQQLRGEPPSANACRKAVAACTHAGAWWAAAAVVAQMQELGHFISLHVIDSVLQACAAADRRREQDAGGDVPLSLRALAPNDRILDILPILPAPCRYAAGRAALATAHELTKTGRSVHMDTVLLLFDALAVGKESEAAMTLFCELRQRCLPSLPIATAPLLQSYLPAAQPAAPAAQAPHSAGDDPSADDQPAEQQTQLFAAPALLSLLRIRAQELRAHDEARRREGKQQRRVRYRRQLLQSGKAFADVAEPGAAEEEARLQRVRVPNPRGNMDTALTFSWLWDPVASPASVQLVRYWAAHLVPNSQLLPTLLARVQRLLALRAARRAVGGAAGGGARRGGGDSSDSDGEEHGAGPSADPHAMARAAEESGQLPPLRLSPAQQARVLNALVVAAYDTLPVSDAARALALARELNPPGATAPHQALLRRLAREGSVVEARVLVANMRRAGLPLTLSLLTTACMAEMVASRWGDAAKIAHDMRADGMRPPVWVYGRLAPHLAGHRNYAAFAALLAAWHEDHGTVPAGVYEHAAIRMAISHRWAHVDEVLDLMEAARHPPSAACVTTLRQLQRRSLDAADRRKLPGLAPGTELRALRHSSPPSAALIAPRLQRYEAAAAGSLGGMGREQLY